jgi:hypothetical protein
MFWFVRRALRALRAPLRRPLEPLLWIAAALSAKDAWVRPICGPEDARHGPPPAPPPVHLERARCHSPRKKTRSFSARLANSSPR